MTLSPRFWRVRPGRGHGWRKMYGSGFFPPRLARSTRGEGRPPDSGPNLGLRRWKREKRNPERKREWAEGKRVALHLHWREKYRIPRACGHRFRSADCSLAKVGAMREWKLNASTFVGATTAKENWGKTEKNFPIALSAEFFQEFLCFHRLRPVCGARFFCAGPSAHDKTETPF